MRLPDIWHFAAFSHILAKCAYRIFFPHILAFSAALNILCSYFSNFRIYPISRFADNQYSLLSEHGGRWCCKLKKLLLPIRPIHVLSRLWYAVNLLNNDCAIPSPQKCTMSDLREYAFAAYFHIFFTGYFRNYMVRIFWKKISAFFWHA